MSDWIKWDDRQPFEGEAAFTIFKNLDTGIYHIYRGSFAPVTQGSFSCGFMPIAWMESPDLPKKYQESNERLKERWSKRNE